MYSLVFANFFYILCLAEFDVPLQLSKTRLIKCSKKYVTKLSTLELLDFVYFIWTNGENNRNRYPPSNRILKDINRTCRKISSTRFSLIVRCISLAQSASCDEEGNTRKPGAAIRKRISASRNKEGNFRKPRIFRKPRNRYKYKINPKTVLKIRPFPQTATVCKTEKPYQYS